MEFNTYFIGDDISDLINLRKFKEQGNSYSAQQPELSMITTHTVIEKVNSITPHIDLSKLLKKMRGVTNYKKQDMFASLDMLGSQRVHPDTVKSDSYQAKRTRMNAPSPSFIPRRHIDLDQSLLITVTLYDSYHFLQVDEVPNVVELNWRSSTQFHDGQTLADVRRAFACQSMDNEISGDGHNPIKSLEYLEDNDLKHTLFYINNNIYVDSQPDEISKDRSAGTMNKWAQDNGYICRKVLSQETPLLDLEICVGEPYIFRHWRQCEHVFVFNEIKFAQPFSSLDCYPRSIII